MHETKRTRLEGVELFDGLSPGEIEKIEPLARPREVPAGDVIFRLGETADTLFIVQAGNVELTLPIEVQGSIHEVRFQSVERGQTLAWSALVPPFRLTMSARAKTDSLLLALRRDDLRKLFEKDTHLGLTVTTNLSKVVGTRLNVTQALWIRELHRSVAHKYG